MAIRDDKPFLRALKRFEDAAQEMAFLGSIPVFGQDREEQEALDEARGAITDEYKRARSCLLNLVDRRLNRK